MNGRTRGDGFGPGRAAERADGASAGKRLDPELMHGGLGELGPQPELSIQCSLVRGLEKE